MEVRASVDPDPERGIGAASATGRARIPGPRARFGVISDIDDTVLKTQATSTLAAARLTVFGNAHTRVPFGGVAPFYRGLVRGGDGASLNPVFYVSSSPWNLYDLLVDFLVHRDLPLGPLFLRDLGLDRERFIQGPHRAHKLEQIEEILGVHPHLPFVLVGDSGQHDPEIYREVVHRHPGRIRAIYIRDVGAPDRGAAVERVADGLSAHDVEMLLVKDTLAAAEHAADGGLVQGRVVGEVKGAVRKR
jgi:phosphatidate phosphatase APP1